MKKKNNIDNKNKDLLLNQKGMALLTTLIFVFVLVTLAVALLTMTSNDSRMSTLQRASNKAFYIAEAGIEDTLWNLNTSTDGGMGVDWRPPSNYPPPGTATEYYQVTIENIGDDDPNADPPTKKTDKIKITSTGVVIGGKYSSGKRKIEVTAEIAFLINFKYLYAILADKIILFQGTPGPFIEGDVHSNDDILVSGHFADNYDGKATCTGDKNDIDGSNTLILPPKTIPVVDYGVLEMKAVPPNGEVHDDVILGQGDVRNWSGIHYIKGNLEAKNGSNINVTNGAIIVEGNVDIKEGAEFNIDNGVGYFNPEDPITALALVAQGNIKIYAKSSILTGVVQSITADEKSEGFIELKNGCEVTGAVIAGTVYVRNKSTVSYSGTLDKITTQGDPFYKKISWREAY